MKSIDIFCASQAATTTMDSSDIHHRPSSSSSATAGRAIDRHNPIIHHQNRLTTTTTPPTTTTTIPNHNKNKKKLIKNPKSSSAFGDENKDEQNKDKDSNHHNNKKPHDTVRRQGGVLLGWGCTRPGDFISPANSSRFLLTDKALLSDQFDPLLKQPPLPPPPPPPPAEEVRVNKLAVDGLIDKSFKKDEVNVFSSSPVKTPPRSSSSSSSDQQVVVLRVSLHCRGCEKKMRKHISKMEGVTSFTIDFLAKKVTVVGDVTPLAVLTSVSKVKNAKLLTPTTIAAPPAPHTGSNISEIKKQLGVVA